MTTTAAVNWLEIDSNEPREMVTMLAPTAQILSNQPLNANGWADYRWKNSSGKYVMVERKTWGEFLANPDRVEEQLQRHLTKNPNVDLVFMLEGVAVQGEIGTHILRPTKSGVWVQEKRRSATYMSRVYSLLYQFADYMKVVQTSSIVESGILLASMYKSDQKATHATFNRNIKKVTFHPDPRVAVLMGSCSGLGDKRATDIIGVAGTPWNFFSAGYCDDSPINDWREFTKLKGISDATIQTALRNIGRPDV